MSKLSLPEFVARWQKATLKESSAAQSHFNDLCDVLGEPHPTDVDHTGETYTFERGAAKTSGGEGWADVWKRGHFGWEYKGKHKDLSAAYQQLLNYHEALESPPLLVVCDLETFEIHTKFTGFTPDVYKFNLADLLANQPTSTCKRPPLEVLRAVFQHPEALRPSETTVQVTEEAAERFSTLAESLRKRGIEPERAAHFLMRLLFCLFAEDIRLLPNKVFTRLVDSNKDKPAQFKKMIKQLFAAMAEGGNFGADEISHFDGGLFMDDEAYDLTAEDLQVLARAAHLNWGSIEPAIFGTLFERSLDPNKRSQLGAHYTSREDIELIVEPVVMAPLRRRWQELQQAAAAIVEKANKTKDASARTRHRKALAKLLRDFVGELSHVRVLDPACGSGNFLYVALKRILDLGKEVSTFAAENHLSGLLPRSHPSQVYGIETNVYAHELASVVVWIGWLQWQHDNGINISGTPILRKLENIERKDAVLAHDAQGNPVEPEWPDTDFIIGNPPFLGGKKLRLELGDKYVDDLFELYDERVPREADLVTYWFEKARSAIEQSRTRRAGLLATQGIRGGANRKVLERIKSSGDIFWAQSDREWVLDGANVRVSMIGFDSGVQTQRVLDGLSVPTINSDLSGATDLTGAFVLKEDANICFMGDTKGGSFDIPPSEATQMLLAVGNPNGRPNSDVVVRWANGFDVTRRARDFWIVDFGVMGETQAAKYEKPFAYIAEHVKPTRELNRRESYKNSWWIHAEPRPAMRESLKGLPRYIATVAVAKHRLFVWIDAAVLPDHALFVFARSDDYFLGVLHSRAHEVWALEQGTALEDRPRYTPTTTFETFPFPWPPGKEPHDDPRVKAIGNAAAALVKHRDAWLNPQGATPEELKKRTLTNLYNVRPQWLQDLHRAIDVAVFAAYGWPADLSDEEILVRLLALNQERAGTSKAISSSASS